MKTKRTRYNFAQRRIAAISILLIILTAVLLTIISTVFYNRFTENSYTSDVESFKKSIRVFLTNYDLTTFTKKDNGSTTDLLLGDAGDAEVMVSMHDYLKQLCEMEDAKYVYLFTVPDKDHMQYIVTAASNDEDDEVVKKERNFGVTISIPDYDIENVHKAAKGEFVGPSEVKNRYGHVYNYYFPIYQDDEVACVVGIDFDVSTVKKEAFGYVFRTVLIVTLVLTTVLSLLLLIMRKKIFIPLKRLSEQMNSYDPEAEHVMLKLNSYYEIEEINNSFAKLSDAIIGYILNNRAMADERAKTAAELDIARKIQIGIVPEHFSLCGDGYEVNAGTAPAKQVGGDFYECFEKDGKVFIIVADVSGKGVAAALFMAMTKTALKAKLMLGFSPADALNATNDELCARNPEGMFVTIFAAMLDPKTGELVYANAGHTRPILIDSGSKEYIIPDVGIALGLFEDAGIINECIVMQDGQSLTIYTDGVTEATDANRTLLGEEKLLECVQYGTAEETAASVIGAVRKFAEGCEQADDITYAVVRYKTDGERVQLDLPTDMSAVPTLREELLKLAGENGDRKIILACEEVLVNIIEYSGADSISVILSRTGSTITVRFEDNGKPFDPFAEIPDEKDFEDYDTGGMGIRMLLNIARNTDYSNISGKNILTAQFEL